MQRRVSLSSRNKLDLSNRVQVRIIRKRLKISEAQLSDLVGKAGDSIAAIRKEASARQVLRLPQAQTPPVAAIAEIEAAEPQQALA